jgi:hypothetical protein
LAAKADRTSTTVSLEIETRLPGAWKIASTQAAPFSG